MDVLLEAVDEGVLGVAGVVASIFERRAVRFAGLAGNRRRVAFDAFRHGALSEVLQELLYFFRRELVARAPEFRAEAVNRGVVVVIFVMTGTCVRLLSSMLVA